MSLGKLTIVSDAEAAGSCRSGHSYEARRAGRYSDDKQRLLAEKEAVVAFAGPAAQRKFNPRTVRHVQGYRDRHHAIDLIENFVDSNEELEAYLKLLNIRARQLVEKWWPFVEVLANALLERRTISGRKATEILQRTFSDSVTKGTGHN